MEIKAFAKINLALKITGILPGGFHSLEMVNLPLDLFDLIDIDVYGHDSLTEVFCPAMPDLKPQSNLCFKAVDCLREKYGFNDNVKISITKNIPSQAGLGGGSSDAASVIAYLNDALKLEMTLSEMDNLAVRIGSDMPYFFRNTCCYLSGFGEKITPVKNNCDFFCLLIKPHEGLSTKEVYAESDYFDKQEIDINALVDALSGGDIDVISSVRGNDLEPAAIKMLPVIGEILRNLKSINGCVSGMSGSGSTVFALCNDVNVLNDLKNEYSNRFWCRIAKVL